MLIFFMIADCLMRDVTRHYSANDTTDSAGSDANVYKNCHNFVWIESVTPFELRKQKG
jgi:hypothetical protein